MGIGTGSGTGRWATSLGHWLVAAAVVSALAGCRPAQADAGDGNGVLLAFPGPQTPAGGMTILDDGVLVGLLGSSKDAKDGALYRIHLNAAGQLTEATVFPFNDSGDTTEPVGAPQPEPRGGLLIATGWGGVEWLSRPDAGPAGPSHATLHRFAPGSLRGLLPLPDGTILAAVVESGAGQVVQLVPSTYRPGETPQAWPTRPVFTAPHGAAPTGSLVRTADGAVFAITRAIDAAKPAAGFNALYRLFPAASGWQSKLVLDFGPASDVPEQPVADEQGRLYAAVPYGGPGQLGTVVRMDPAAAAGGPWRTEELFHFNASVGGRPLGRLARDASGALYGGTALGPGLSSGGSLFRLAPAPQDAAPWTLTTLLRLMAADERGLYAIDGLQRDGHGAVFAVLAPRSGGGFGSIVRIAP